MVKSDSTILERKAIGEITRNGGISLVANKAENGVATLLYKQNEPIAIVLPCDRKREKLYSDAMILRALISVNRDTSFDASVVGFVESLIELGEAARQMLSVLHHAGDFDAAQADFIDKVNIMRNSSEESGSVSPMTTARADVSEVKQEGVDSTPSLPRKRGRPRKT